MQTITSAQIKSLEDIIYASLMAVEIIGNDGKSNSLGMGEMGEARDEAARIINEWMETNNITEA